MFSRCGCAEESQSQRLCRAVRQVDQRGVFSHAWSRSARAICARLVYEYREHYHRERNHQGLDNQLLPTTTTSAKAGRRRSAAGTPREDYSVSTIERPHEGRPIKRTLRRRWKKASGYHQQRAWRMRSSGTSRSSATVFGHAVHRGNGVRPCSRVNVLNPDDRAWQTRLVPHR